MYNKQIGWLIMLPAGIWITIGYVWILRFGTFRYYPVQENVYSNWNIAFIILFVIGLYLYKGDPLDDKQLEKQDGK